MTQAPENGPETGLYHQELTDESNVVKARTTLGPHADGQGADMEEENELLTPLPGSELAEEEEKDRK